MKREIIVGIFAALQALEKQAEECRRTALDSKQHSPDICRGIAEQIRVIREMRRTANKLQMELAADHWPAAIRLMSIFYGLNHMVRPEVIKSFALLASNHLPLARQGALAFH